MAIPGAADDARQCAQCRGDSDCGAGTLCVDFQCRACDHTKGNSGCSNPTPICNIDNTCVACDASHACPAPLSCTGGRCFGCDVTNNNGCDAASTTPVCDLAQGSLQCEACAADAECNGNLNGGQCTATGACHACDRAEGAINPACTDASKRYCDAATDSCRGCTDSDCTAAGKTRCAKAGASNGQCVECTESGQCSGRRPTCNTASGVCQACGNDADCTGSAGGPACGTSGGIAGRCVECTADRHCGGLTPKCNTANNSCVQCAASSDCANLNAPVCASGICVPCGLGGGNAACSAKNPAFPACRNNVTCSVCNTQNQGCGGATPICNAGGSACVGCLSATDCNDGNLCTTDSCSAANACSYAAVVPTSDNDLCTTDACVPATGATSHTAITCTAPTPACLPASGCVACDPSANVVGPPASNVNCAAGFNCSPTGTCVMAP